jgi:hypothetical protein
MRSADGALQEQHVRSNFPTLPPFSELQPPNAENFLRIEQGFEKLAATYKGKKYLHGDIITLPLISHHSHL